MFHTCFSLDMHLNKLLSCDLFDNMPYSNKYLIYTQGMVYIRILLVYAKNRCMICHKYSKFAFSVKRNSDKLPVEIQT